MTYISSKPILRLMTLANKVTSIRLILAPIFFVIFITQGSSWTVPILWIIFIGSELTDLLDGIIARKKGEISDFGKLYDPFADTLTQITYFLCFVIEGIFPPLLFLVVLYREFSVLFVRNQLLSRGITLAAGKGGKVKTVTYVLSGALALAASSIIRLGYNEFDFNLYGLISCIAAVVFLISVIIAIISFVGYVSILLKTPIKTPKE